MKHVVVVFGERDQAAMERVCARVQARAPEAQVFPLGIKEAHAVAFGATVRLVVLWSPRLSSTEKAALTTMKPKHGFSLGVRLAAEHPDSANRALARSWVDEQDDVAAAVEAAEPVQVAPALKRAGAGREAVQPQVELALAAGVVGALAAGVFGFGKPSLVAPASAIVADEPNSVLAQAQPGPAPSTRPALGQVSAPAPVAPDVSGPASQAEGQRALAEPAAPVRQPPRVRAHPVDAIGLRLSAESEFRNSAESVSSPSLPVLRLPSRLNEPLFTVLLPQFDVLPEWGAASLAASQPLSSVGTAAEISLAGLSASGRRDAS